MPGLSLFANRISDAPRLNVRGAPIRGKMLHFQNYTTHSLVENDRVDFGYTGYPGYPVKIFSGPGYTLLLEGRIYNYDSTQIETGARELAGAFVRSETAPLDALKRFLSDADGEFVIAIYDTQNQRVLTVNDALGRLPLYYRRTDTVFAVAREMKFLLPLLSFPEANRGAVMEYLLYGYPFGENTLIEGIQAYPPATCMVYDTRTGVSVSTPYLELNFDSLGPAQERPRVVADMRQLFLKALADRTRGLENDKIILSLSGGMDSRGVLAGLSALGHRPVAVTAQSAEEASARNVAGVFDTPVYPIAQRVAHGTLDFAAIVFLKDGLDCHPDLAQLYHNLHDLRARFGETCVYFTGIYGGEITRHSHPTSGLPSVDALARYLMSAQDQCRYSTEKVLALFHATPQMLTARLRQRLMAFPEKDVYRKYLRFRHESDLRFAGEAEDRNRFYLWSITPYLALPFFRYVMGLDENRKDAGLFRDFLFSIDPRTTRVPYYDFRLPLNNPLLLWTFSRVQRWVRHVAVKNALRRVMRQMGALRRRLNGKKRDTTQRDALRTVLTDTVLKSEMAGRCFDKKELLALIRNEEDLQGLERLRIVIVYLDEAARWHQRFSGGEA